MTLHHFHFNQSFTFVESRSQQPPKNDTEQQKERPYVPPMYYEHTTDDGKFNENTDDEHPYQSMRESYPQPKNDERQQKEVHNVPSLYHEHTTELKKKNFNNPHLNKQLNEMHQINQTKLHSYVWPGSRGYSTQPPIGQHFHDKQRNDFQSMPKTTRRQELKINKLSQDDQFAQYHKPIAQPQLHSQQYALVDRQKPSNPTDFNGSVIPNEKQRNIHQKPIEQGKFSYFN